ncbi:MAG TPA: type I-B CRISPR-associated endonuclease Cas1b [Saprospiraceae bacterium]|nr:type I-B CRISPR-associated endonuclease Cas1b [Saprospiraceae bacterium]
MRRTYYLFNNGQMSRRDNTLCFIARNSDGIEQAPKYIPIETIESMYVFGALDVNAALLNFLGKKDISLHFFDYYEHYTGSFMPKDQLLAGKMQIEQTKTYLNKKRRLHIAVGLIEGATFNMLKNLKYYNNRGKSLLDQINLIEQYKCNLDDVTDIPELMGLEGNCRQIYYRAFDEIIENFTLNARVKQPPDNEINALISFGNMVCYTLTLDMIHHTQLNPTISFLHEPGYRRYSLALDISEVFKPILVDRTIFRVLNKKEIQIKHFDKHLNGCFLNENGKKVFMKAWEERLSETIKHRTLKKNVSYKSLVKLECYKLAKYILKDEPSYNSFKIWW